MDDGTIGTITVRYRTVLPEYCYMEVPGLVLNPMVVATHMGVTDTVLLSLKTG